MFQKLPALNADTIRSGSPTFFAAPLVSDLSDFEADVAFLGVPFDHGVNDRPGSRFGPLAIRDASMRLAPVGLDGWYDLEEDRHFLKGVHMADVGDVNIRNVDRMINFDKITEAVSFIRGSGAFPVIVGGDHSITFPIIRAFGDLQITVIDFDAHMDFTDEWKGQRYSHDNQMRRVIELPFVKRLCQLGIRTMFDRTEPLEAAKRYGVTVIPALELIRRGPAEVIDSLELEGPCYVSIDIDVMDPSAVPGTGYPEPGGLSYYQLKEAIVRLGTLANVVGLDLVEVSPPHDILSGVTARTASRLLLDTLGAVFRRRE